MDPSVPPVIPSSQAPPAGAPSSPLEPAQAPSEPKKKSSLVKIFIALLVVAVLLGGGFLVYKLFFARSGGDITSRKAELTWWGLWEDTSIVAPLIEEYQASHPNVTITYVAQSKEDYRERLTNALARGEGPDIFRIHNSWVPMFSGDLSPLPASVMTQQEYSEAFYPVALSDFSSGTGIVAIPLMYDGLGLYINEQIFETYGAVPPVTWDDLLSLAVEMTIKGEEGQIEQAGVALGRTENVDHWPEILALMMLQNGADLGNPTGALGEGALKYYSNFSQQYGVWDETLPASTQAFAAGKVAMYLGPSWRAFEISAQNPALRYRVVTVPQLPKDNPSDPDISYASYWGEAVWSRGSDPEIAWDFLKFMSTQDSLQKLYANAAKIRAFGEPYPRVDMRSSLLSDPVVGGFVQGAPNAKSWYLATRTFDGPTGINSQVVSYYEDAVNSLNLGRGGDAATALETVTNGMTQVLSTYGLVKAPTTPAK